MHINYPVIQFLSPGGLEMGRKKNEKLSSSVHLIHTSAKQVIGHYTSRSRPQSHVPFGQRHGTVPWRWPKGTRLLGQRLRKRENRRYDACKITVFLIILSPLS